MATGVATPFELSSTAACGPGAVAGRSTVHPMNGLRVRARGPTTHRPNAILNR